MIAQSTLVRIREVNLEDTEQLIGLYHELLPWDILDFKTSQGILEQIMYNDQYHIFVLEVNKHIIATCTLVIIHNLMHQGKPYGISSIKYWSYFGYQKKENRRSRINSKLDMMTVLLKGYSIIIFPETTWNLSPNLLHLPFNYGFLDVAQKTGKPVVSMVIEYTYNTSKPIERITNVHIRYGKSIVVGENDNILDKLEEYTERISTHNDVPWVEWGELRQTDEVERLKQINRKYKI